MYFFTHEIDLPSDVGFAHFGTAHLLWLVGIMAVITMTAHFYRRWTEGRRQLWSRGIAWTMCTMTLAHMLMLYAIGRLTVYNVPLHLCGLAPFLCLLFAYHSWDWVGQTLYALCLPGAVAALLFPDWNMYPMFNCTSLHSFILHGLLVLFCILQLVTGDIRPRLQSIWKPWGFLAMILPIIYWFNQRFGTNYFFIMQCSHESPLTFLQDYVGQENYFLSFVGLIFLLMLVLYLPWEILRKNKRT